MKAYFIKIFSFVFILQTTLSTFAFAENEPPSSSPSVAASSPNPEEKPYSAILMKGAPCHGKEELLNSFINTTELADENGAQILDENQKPLTYKGKLTENETEYGDRNFDFDKLHTALFYEDGDEQTKQCLAVFTDTALTEWKYYFQILSDKNKCGLSLMPVSDSTKTHKVDIGKKSKDCDIPNGNETLYDFLHKQMTKFTEVVNGFVKKSEDINRIGNETKAEISKTESGICPGHGCPNQSKEVKDSAQLKDTTENVCCDRIKERWEILGFTTIKDAKPNDRICKEMLDKETDTGICEDFLCRKDLGNCLKNFAGAFLRDFFTSFVDSWKVWAWGSQLMTLLREIIANPGKVSENIVKNLFGGDGEYMSCLNKKSQTQYVCQMIGKFVGSTAGFSAGLGALTGLIGGVSKGLIAKSSRATNLYNKAANKMSLSSHLAHNPKSSILFKPLKEARVKGFKAAGFGIVAPLYMTRGVAKGTFVAAKTILTGLPSTFRKVKTGTASVMATSAGRLAQGGGAYVAKRSSANSAELAAVLERIGQGKLEKAAQIRANAKAAARVSAPSGKIGAKITDMNLAIKQFDDGIVALEKIKNQITAGRTLGKDGKVKFRKGDPKAKELDEVTNQLKGLQNTRAEATKKLDELKQQVKKNTYNNVMGVGITTGAVANKYTGGSKEEKEKSKSLKSGGEPGLSAAPAVEGIGAGVPPKAAPVKPAPTQAPVPAAPIAQPLKPPVETEVSPQDDSHNTNLTPGSPPEMK